MKSIVRFGWCNVLVLLAAAPSVAQDRIPWVADFHAACGMAAEQHRLVLVHFFNDNCGPCVRVDQNVFSQAEVAEAVAQNYVAVKVHAGKNPQLATRYRVNQWPTDVFVTPSGLEVYRTVSPKEPAEYIGLLHQVAQQTGIGAARQWKSQLAQAGDGAVADAQNAANQTQQRWGAAGSQFQAAADQARAAAGQSPQYVTAAAQQAEQRAAEGGQQATAAMNQWSQQAKDTVQRYEQQGGEAYRQFRDQAGHAAEHVQHEAQGAKQDWRVAAQQASDAARDARSQLLKGTSASPFDRRSAFVPADPSPASQPAALAAVAAGNAAAAGPAAASVPPATSPALSQSAASTPPPPADMPKAPPVQPVVPTNNPWIAAAPSEPATSSAAPTNTIAATSPAAPPNATNGTSAALAAAPAANNAPLIPASQAPPIALDGFCPVTLLETVARDPTDRSAWKKGDRQFGAIHRGRTYLFASAEQQQKFLANPEAFAPVLNGFDPVRYAERGELVDGKRAYGLVTPERRIYLFADEASRNRYEQSPAAYSNTIQQAMLRNEGGNVYR